MHGKSLVIQVGDGRTYFLTLRRYGDRLLVVMAGTDMDPQSETYTPATPQIQAQYPASPNLRPHGTNGPVGSSYPPFSFDQIRLWFSGWSSLGVLVNPQSNAGRAVGAIHSSLSLAQPNVSRSSASDAYFKGEPSLRDNFDLMTGHRVVKILFEATTATGVQVSEQ